jgi:Arc/MetJ-type ribon-helix-helix transcriptional regulator
MGKQIILEVDDAMARELEAVAPSRKRQRSEFLRRALRKALDEAAEAKMRDAYRRQPDSAEPYAFDPRAWTVEDRPTKLAPKRRRK